MSFNKTFAAAGEGPIQVDSSESFQEALLSCYGEQFTVPPISLHSAVYGELPTWFPLRRLQYNRYLTNAVRPNGRPNGFDIDEESDWSEAQRAVRLNKLALDDERSLDPSVAAASTCIWADKAESKILETSIAFTIRACFQQHFYDGKHRTAILCLISDLSASGYSLNQLRPFHIYRILGSHSPAATWSEDDKDFTNSFSKASAVAKKLLTYLEDRIKRDHPASPVNVEALQPWAGLVKDIPLKRVEYELSRDSTRDVII